MVNKTKLVYGWGINDVDYPVKRSEKLPKLNGKTARRELWVCPYYTKWKGIIQRCFNLKFQEKSPTYKGCTIYEGWKYLSNFIKWVDSQPNGGWMSLEIDKDFLYVGNKHYSPETVIFISKKINNFIKDCGRARGSQMLGVCYKPSESKKNPYVVSCSNPFSHKQEYLGRFSTELEAHKAWKAKKHEHACALADTQTDERVVKVLRERYAPDKDWTHR